MGERWLDCCAVARTMSLVCIAVWWPSVIGCTPALPPARYMNWEPTSAQVPLVRDREVALRYLDQSWAIWKRYPEDDYTYARALQTASDSVEFTVVTVKRGHPHRRTVLVGNPDEFGDLLERKEGRPLSTVSDEFGDSVASERTVPQIYGRCRSQIEERRSGAGVRLAFHPWGLLQHCGYLESECDDCESVSIQAFSKYAAYDATPITDYFCADRVGLFPSNQLIARDCETCRCQMLSDAATHCVLGHPMPEEGLSAFERVGVSGRWDCRTDNGSFVGGFCPLAKPFEPRCVGKKTPRGKWPPSGCRGGWSGTSTVPDDWQGLGW